MRFWKLGQGLTNPAAISTPEVVVDLDWNPDGPRLVSAALQEKAEEIPIRVWDVAARQQVGPTRPGGAAIGWSPNGRQIASGVDRWRLRVWDADAPTPAALHTQDRADRPQELPGEPVRTACLHWSPDGSRLATGSFDGVTIWDMQRRVEGKTLVAAETARWVRSLCWSPDGDRLAVAYRDVTPEAAHTVVVWDMRDFTIVWQTPPPGDGRSFVDALSWSPNGRHLALADWDRLIRVRDAATGDLVSEHQARTHGAVALHWSPDSTRLASGGADGTVRVWMPGVPDAVIVMRGHTRSLIAVRWSLDGTRLASAAYDRTVRIWDGTRGYRWARSLR